MELTPESIQYSLPAAGTKHQLNLVDWWWFLKFITKLWYTKYSSTLYVVIETSVTVPIQTQYFDVVI